MGRTTSTESPREQPSRPRANRGVVASLLLAGIAMFIAVVGITSANSPAAPPAEAAPMTPPGLQADVQRWMQGRDRALVELNDALVPIVQRQLDRPGAGSPQCRRLDAAIKALNARGRAPHAEIDELARAGQAKLTQAAAACLAGDLPTTQQLVTEAMAERAAASLPLDEALEGE